MSSWPAGGVVPQASHHSKLPGSQPLVETCLDQGITVAIPMCRPCRDSLEVEAGSHPFRGGLRSFAPPGLFPTPELLDIMLAIRFVILPIAHLNFSGHI